MHFYKENSMFSFTKQTLLKPFVIAFAVSLSTLTTHPASSGGRQLIARYGSSFAGLALIGGSAYLTGRSMKKSCDYAFALKDSEHEQLEEIERLNAALQNQSWIARSKNWMIVYKK
jgi:hypothetical protein